MTNLQRLTTVMSESVRLAGQMVKEARQVAADTAVTTGKKVGGTVVTATNATGPALVAAVNQVINTAPKVVAAAQQVATQTVNVLRSPAGQRAASILTQVALASAARLVVRSAFGPIAGNVAAGVVGLVAAIREVKLADKAPEPEPQTPA